MLNDFLSNLCSRALQPSEIDTPGSGLKPRPASRFESMHGPDGLAVEQAHDTESLIETGTDGGLRHRVSMPDRMPLENREPTRKPELRSGLLAVQEHRAEQAKRSFTNDGKPVVSHAVKPVPAAEPSDMLPRPFAPAHAQQAELPNPALSDAKIVQPTIFPSFPENSPSVETRQIIENHTTIIEMQSSSIDPKKGIQTLTTSLPSSQAKVIPERIEITRIERPAQAPPKGSQIVPSLQSPALTSQSKVPEAQEQPPTIHVTIGRIEVRAAPPAVAPKRRTPASPTMSLDEYLRRRSGGER